MLAIVSDSRLARPRERLQDLGMIRQIKFVSIPVTDQDRALDFYTKKLGFRVVTDAPFSGDQRWIELAIPRAETRVVLFTPEEHKKMIGGFMNISFTADNVETTVRELKDRGVLFTQEPTTADWGTFAMFQDPDGNKFLVSTG
jgi:catechol 2,3-dioxygenase-like lactoylglutathione lyase family enzyme